MRVDREWSARAAGDEPELTASGHRSGMREWSWENSREAEALGLDVIGRGVRAARYRAGLSQQQLAWRTRVNQATISRIETGKLRSLRLSTLARIVGVLDMGSDFLFPREPPGPTRRLPGSTHI